ncbi:DinB family protein [Maribacter halichondriae]|uniref:DinB family protein n=1 Tax=Maribacter halichondriae TaxID=2980554 RepID=UPI00235A0B20|nr:DinB family protein [Maribacter sp. Hal144]
MQNPQLETIVHNLKECFDGKPWYGISVMEKLDAVPLETVNDKRYGLKSIAVLVKHIINWRIFLIKKLEGDTEYDLKIDGPTDWTAVHIESEQEWISLKDELIKTQQDLLNLLSNATDELLQEKVPGKNYKFGPVLTSIAQHDIYHLGQIAMLNSMSGG